MHKAEETSDQKKYRRYQQQMTQIELMPSFVASRRVAASLGTSGLWSIRACAICSFFPLSLVPQFVQPHLQQLT